MGKGKGSPEYWAARVKPGRIMFEIDGVPDSVARAMLCFLELRNCLLSVRLLPDWQTELFVYEKNGALGS